MTIGCRPDHFQESPTRQRGALYHPHNIGLFLVSTLSAFDLGYMGVPELAVRLRSTLIAWTSWNTRGHLLIGMTRKKLGSPATTLYFHGGQRQPGGLPDHAAKQGCLALKDAPLLGDRHWQGLLVIMDILAETLEAAGEKQPASHPGNHSRAN